MKNNKNRKSNRWILLMFLPGIFLAFFGWKFLSRTKSCSFPVSPSDQIYVVAKNGITGFSYTDGQLAQTSDSKMEILKDGINQCVHRAKIQDRWLVASEENRFGENGRVLSVDFENGKVQVKKTPVYAFTSAGESEEYYFVSTSAYDNSYLAVYSPSLELIDTYTFESPVLLYDFSVQGQTVYLLGVPLANNESYSTYWYEFEIKDDRLVLKQSGIFDQAEGNARYFGDSALIGNLLVAPSPGSRGLVSGERDYSSPAILVRNLVTGEINKIMTARAEPYNLYDLRDGYVAFDHASGSSSELGFTLVNLADLSSTYVPLETQPDPTGETEYFQSLSRLDDQRIAALTTKALWIYNYATGQMEASFLLPDHIEWPFEIWIRP